MQPVINPDLQLAFEFVQYTNRNIFLTGKAGTGKTTFLHNLKKKSPKRMIVVAPTGVAAINAGGVTIHSFFQLPFHPHIPTQYIHDVIPGTPEDSSSFKLSRDKVRIIKGLDLLVIDEISMVRADLLDAVDKVLRRLKDKTAAFGGVQLLMIGDIQQLAPVAKQDEWEVLESYYETPFFFGSLALRSTDYVTIELKHIYRQQDQHFIELLNRVRDNHLDPQSLAALNKRVDPHFKPEEHSGYITLTTHNSQAQSINDTRLDQLPSKGRIFKAIVNNEFPEYAYPTNFELTLKTGAQVMFVKNDISGNKLFFNGKIGKIEGFEDEHILVKCPGDAGFIPVEMAEWQNMKYALNEDTKEIEETVIGTFTQYPLKLAWAITIHKSQGLTFDNAVIDARAAFAHGQVYVALSRCRTLEGMVLSTPISQHGIISDPTVTGFVHECEQNQPDEKHLTESRRAYQKTLLSELFDFTPLIRSLYYLLKIMNEHAEILLGMPNIKIESSIACVKNDLILISEKFDSQLNYHLAQNADTDTNTALQERIGKACHYFYDKLLSVKEILAEILVETDNKVVRKSISETLERIRQDADIKLACLEQMKKGFSISEYLETKAKAALTVTPQKTKAEKSIEDSSGVSEHPALFNRIRKWRDRLAKEVDLPHYMILPQKTMATLTTVLPRNMEALRTIKGIGRQKIEMYGDELLAIIDVYCEEKNIAPAVYIPKPSSRPKDKRNTREISFTLYKAGKSIAEIAAERDLSMTTIEEHLAFFIATGQIPISELVSPDITELIASHFEQEGPYLLGPVKSALGDQVSWSDIRFVARHLEYMEKINLKI